MKLLVSALILIAFFGFLAYTNPNSTAMTNSSISAFRQKPGNPMIRSKA